MAAQAKKQQEGCRAMQVIDSVKAISNSEFLRTVYGELPIGQHGWVCNFRESPESAPPSVWMGRAYKGRTNQAGLIDRAVDDNTYFSTAVLRATDDDEICRRKDAFVRLAALVVDDVQLGDLMGDPTWVLETSPGKHQVGIKINADDPDAGDRDLVDRVMEQLGGRAGNDQAGNACVRYVRLAVGTNTKPAAAGFKHRVARWKPGHELSLDEACKAFGIELDALRGQRLTTDQTTTHRGNQEARLRSLAANILRGDDLHDSVAQMAASLVASGTNGGTTTNILRGLMDVSQAPRDERYQSRFNDIPRAVATAQEKFSPKAPAIDPDTGEVLEHPPLQPVSLRGVGQGQEPATEHKIEAWVPERVVTLLSAHGGTGKSLLALSMAVALTTGQPFAELACKRSRVLLLSCEDDDLVLRHRLDQLLQDAGLTDEDLDGQLVVYDMTDRDSVLYASGREGGHLTPQYEWLRQRIEHHRADVVIVDNASDVYADNENDRGRVRQFVRALTRLVRDRNGAVLLLAHVDKSTARGSAAGSESYSGSTAWHNSVRSRLSMAEEDGHIVVRHEKANYGPRAADVRLVRSGAILRLVGEHAIDPAAGMRRDMELAAVLKLMLDFEQRGERISTAPNQPNNPYRLLSSEKQFPRSITKSGMNSVMRELERRRFITKREDRTANRKVVERWALTSEGLHWLESKGAPSAPRLRHA
ncbi:MAG: hypothetical protein EBR82_58630 [Caulobacteraceae bacterium]|nr:hypothetical protein [Caulobacteraceae bacterium]